MKTSASRRNFLSKIAVAAAGACLFPRRPAPAFGFANLRNEQKDVVKRFVFAQLRYPGGDWDPHPSAPAEFIREIERMTSVEVAPERREVAVTDAQLFSFPFLYIAGRRDFNPFTGAEIERLRAWIEAGGTLVADDAAGTPGYGFDAAFRRELARVAPAGRLERLPAEHTVFKSFFLVRTVAGALAVSPFLEGLTIQGRTAVVFSPNNLLGAFARDPLGRWVDPCAPGGDRQRRLAFHLGVNIVMYALCGDYKQDRIHLPFLRQRI
ncbi:MAG: DUF4159 domain-containing protein [Candidatus Methylomirabilia bacterium]